MSHDFTPSTPDHSQRERLLRMLSIATFIIFFQAYMVAPIIPALSTAFGASVHTVGLVVPAYLIPYGIATLIFGLLADRLGVQPLMFASLTAFAPSRLSPRQPRRSNISCSGESSRAWAPAASCRSRLCWLAACTLMSNADARSVGCLARWLGAWLSARPWVLC